MAEEKDQKEKGRQLKIRGIEGEEVQEKGKKKEKKEKESKWWVLVILVATMLISLVFSARAENGWLEAIFRRQPAASSEKAQSKGTKEVKEGETRKAPSWFGTKTYEFEN